jgi:hypothetical protein
MMMTHPTTGEAIEASELAKEVGIKAATLERRWYNGDRGERLVRPVNPKLAKLRAMTEEEKAKLRAMAEKVEHRQRDRVRQTPEWAMLTAPRLGDYAHHYAQLRNSR